MRNFPVGSFIFSLYKVDPVFIKSMDIHFTLFFSVFENEDFMKSNYSSRNRRLKNMQNILECKLWIVSKRSHKSWKLVKHGNLLWSVKYSWFFATPGSIEKRLHTIRSVVCLKKMDILVKVNFLLVFT